MPCSVGPHNGFVIFSLLVSIQMYKNAKISVIYDLYDLQPAGDLKHLQEPDLSLHVLLH